MVLKLYETHLQYFKDFSRLIKQLNTFGIYIIIGSKLQNIIFNSI